MKLLVFVLCFFFIVRASEAVCEFDPYKIHVSTGPLNNPAFTITMDDLGFTEDIAYSSVGNGLNINLYQGAFVAEMYPRGNEYITNLPVELNGTILWNGTSVWNPDEDGSTPGYFLVIAEDGSAAIEFSTKIHALSARINCGRGGAELSLQTEGPAPDYIRSFVGCVPISESLDGLNSFTAFSVAASNSIIKLSLGSMCVVDSIQVGKLTKNHQKISNCIQFCLFANPIHAPIPTRNAGTLTIMTHSFANVTLVGNCQSLDKTALVNPLKLINLS